MRKVCRDRFGPAASGTCPTCEKYMFSRIGMPLFHRYRLCRDRFGPPASGTCPTCEKYMFSRIGMPLVNSPASPTSAEDGNRTRTPSPCMDLDEITTDSSVTDASPQDFKVTLLYNSEDSCTPVGSIVSSSDEDLPLSPGQEDRRKVRKRDTRVVSRTLSSVRIIVPFFCMASSSLSILHQLILIIDIV